MDLRNVPTDLDAPGRIDERRHRAEKELGMDLAVLTARTEIIGSADQRNCEQMIGHVPLPVGLAGPLLINFSNGMTNDVWLPLATTEGALVASINRGCKAISESGGARTLSLYHGMTRSLAFKICSDETSPLTELHHHEKQWRAVGEATSKHLKVLSYDIDTQGEYLFLNIACDTDEAMGMNMVTIAAQAIGQWIDEMIDGLRFVTVAGNVDSDKKPSKRVHARGRGYEVTTTVLLPHAIIEKTLKSSADAMLTTAHAKLAVGSRIAGAIGANLHTANVIAALYLATGQDIAHVVEGSLADTTVRHEPNGLAVSVRLPAVLVGVRGGGTALPAQAKALEMLLKKKAGLKPVQQLTETIGAAVLAGEISLLAAQASHTLANAHRTLGRLKKK